MNASYSFSTLSVEIYGDGGKYVIIISMAMTKEF